MTVRELINELIKFNPDKEIFFYEEETGDILNITDTGDQNDLPYIFFQKENEEAVDVATEATNSFNVVYDFFSELDEFKKRKEAEQCQPKE